MKANRTHANPIETQSKPNRNQTESKANQTKPKLTALSRSPQAYYATHYGHGNNKIIAKLLRIPNQSNGYGFNNSAQSNHRQQHSNRDHHYAGSNVSSPSSNFSDRSYSFPAVQQSNAAQKSPTTLNFAHTNSSFSEDTLAQYSFGSSNHNNSFGEQRRGFGELAAHQARAQMNSSMANTTLDVNELLGRNNQRPRAIFKQRQRRLSPSTSQQQFMLDMQHSNAASLMNQSFAAHSSANREHSKQSRCHSFSASNQMLLSPLALQSTPANTQRSGSLTLDLGVNFNNQQSPTGSTGTSNCSPDQGYSSWPKQNIFRYDELSPPFQSPTSPCENRSFDDQHQSTKQDLSILNMNVSWQDSNDETPNDQPRNKPRNSTFVQTADQSSYNLANSHSTSSSSQLASLESAWNQPCATSLDQKFGELADDLNDFLGQQSKHLGQRDLQELSELFAEKHIGLYRFLTMSEDDLKAIGISQHQHLATLIAAQVDFLRQIGIESGSETSNETMRYVIFLGSRLERAKKELVKLQNELKMYRMGGLHDIDMKGSRMQSSYPGF